MGKIFWGLIFVFFHIRFNGVDILPDFVGYLLIASGMNELRQSGSFPKDCPEAVGAAIFEGILWVVSFGGGLGVWMGLGSLALRLLVTYRILQGVEVLAGSTGQNLGAHALRMAWNVLAVGAGVGFLLNFMAPVPAAIALVVSIVAAVYYIVKIYQCKQLLVERRLN